MLNKTELKELEQRKMLSKYTVTEFWIRWWREASTRAAAHLPAANALQEAQERQRPVNPCHRTDQYLVIGLPACLSLTWEVCMPKVKVEWIDTQDYLLPQELFSSLPHFSQSV